MQERAIDPHELMRRLADEREARGLTQAAVAKKMRTSQPYIARLEAAQSDPRLSTVLRYAAIVVGAALLATILTELEGDAAGSRRPR